MTPISRSPTSSEPSSPGSVTTASNGVLLRLKNVSRTFQTGDVKVPVLMGIDLEIQRGEFAVLVGPSGSGKTTLINLIGGLDTPTSGEVWFVDQNLADQSEAALTLYRRDHVGFIFQLYNLVPTLTALENVLVSTEISQKPLEPEEALEMVDLGDRLHHFPSQLSGGEQQRVAIARALAKNPDLLLCDEPTGALDLPTAQQVLGVLARLNQEMNKTVLLITHNLAIARMARRIVRLGSGRIVEDHVNETPCLAEEVSW